MNLLSSPLQAVRAMDYTIRQFAAYESAACATWAELALICLVWNIPCHHEAEDMVFAGVPLDTPKEATRFMFELLAR